MRWQAAETGTRFPRPGRALLPLRQGEQVEGAHSWATVHRLSLLSPGPGRPDRQSPFDP